VPGSVRMQADEHDRILAHSVSSTCRHVLGLRPWVAQNRRASPVCQQRQAVAWRGVLAFRRIFTRIAAGSPENVGRDIAPGQFERPAGPGAAQLRGRCSEDVEQAAGEGAMPRWARSRCFDLAQPAPGATPGGGRTWVATGAVHRRFPDCRTDPRHASGGPGPAAGIQKASRNRVLLAGGRCHRSLPSSPGCWERGTTRAGE